MCKHIRMWELNCSKADDCLGHPNLHLSCIKLPYSPVSRLYRFPAAQTGNDPASSHHQRSTISTAGAASHRPICAAISLQSFSKLQPFSISVWLVLFIQCFEHQNDNMAVRNPIPAMTIRVITMTLIVSTIHMSSVHTSFHLLKALYEPHPYLDHIYRTVRP